MLGSSLKNKGVQALMDAVIKYLPSPFERPPVTAKHVEGGTSVVRNPDKKDKLCGLAFKVVNDF